MSKDNQIQIAVCSKCNENLTAICCKSCNAPVCIPCLDVKIEGEEKDVYVLSSKCLNCGGDLEYL